MRRLPLILLYAALIALAALSWRALDERRAEAQRGIWLPGQPLPPGQLAQPLGATVALEQYEDEAALGAALDAAEALGLTWLRQPLPWQEVEPAAGRFEWERWDRLIEAASARGFELVLVIKTTPEWARREGEFENPFAPPSEPELGLLADFARAAAERYGERVTGWELWEEPNLAPNWGTAIILVPEEYATFLSVVAPAVREGDPGAIIATAALGPTAETGGYNMNEPRYLDGVYAAGGAEHFDAVTLKPYGFWNGPTDRVYDETRVGLDTVVLAREVMVAHGDAETPIWFAEGGWAALPPDWEGAASPWGSDSAEWQQARLESAIQRVALEWPWVTRIALQPLQPNVPPDDPRWGLAMLDPTGEITPLGESTARMAREFFGGAEGEAARAEWERVARPTLLRFDWAQRILAVAIVAMAGRALWHFWKLPWDGMGAHFRRLPEGAQMAIMGALALAFYLAPGLLPSLLLYAVLIRFLLWRPDLGLAGVALAIPFFLQAKDFGGPRFSMVELLLLPTALAWGWRELRAAVEAPGSVSARLRALVARLVMPRDALDWAVLLFALWAAASVFFADLFGVAAREFRVVVAESALFFWLIRRLGLDETQRRRLVGALIVAGTVTALYGLYQWFFTADIIQAEGVRRVRGPYASPNNLSLLLVRVLAMAGGLALLAPAGRVRVAAGLAALPLALALFLTFSRGAWLLGVPVGLLFLAYWGGRTTRRLALGGVVLALLALIPFATTERIASIANLEGGTWFIRFKLWEATAAMLRDHPLLGVGLDNFLYEYQTYRLPEAWREPNLSHPHQLFLHFWVALGLPGLAFLFWQQGSFWATWRARMAAAPRGGMARALLVGLGASMAATLAHGMIDNSYFLVDLAFIWMMTLALVAEAEAPTPPAFSPDVRGGGERNAPMTPITDLAADLARLSDDEWAARFLDAARADAGAVGAALLDGEGQRVAAVGNVPERVAAPSELIGMAPASGALWLPGAEAAAHEGLAALGGLRWALAEARAEEARRREGQEHFFSMLNHDLKGPLAGIKAIADLIGWRMARGKLDPGTPEGRAELEQRFAALGRRVTEMATLIEEVGELGRVIRGRLTIEPTAGDLGAIARAAAQRFDERGEYEIVVEESGDPLPIYADGRRIAALLNALFLNSEAYSEATTAITLRLRREGGHAVAEVRDGGQGIAPALQARLFREYGRAVQATASGLGIGLYVAQAVARAHGGALRLESVPGRGTVVTLALPLTRGDGGDGGDGGKRVRAGLG